MRQIDKKRGRQWEVKKKHRDTKGKIHMNSTPNAVLNQKKRRLNRDIEKDTH